MSEKVFREKLSLRGHKFWLLEDRFVPRIPDAFLDCVVYLYHSASDAQAGAVHSNGGSGFLVGIPTACNKGTHIYAVSNRHVIETSPVIRLNTKAGELDVLDAKVDNWSFTQDQDIAVCGLGLNEVHHKFKCLPLISFVTRQLIENQEIGPGDDVFMVGRFVNHEGKQRNTPSVRFGNLAMMPEEPVFHKRNTPKEQISFLADIRTVGGYSGSPVFWFPPLLDFRAGVTPTNRGILLLGVEWGHLLDHDDINTGMSGVVPAWCLFDLLHRPELVTARQNREVAWKAAEAKGPTQLT